VYGVKFDSDSHLTIDPEEKITEYNYEKFLPEDLIKTMDVRSAEFKETIKMLNYSMKTRYEQLQADKAKFVQMMPMLSKLDKRQQKDLVHMLHSQSDESQLLDALCNNEFEKELAKRSEAENFAIKNRYRHHHRTMVHADPKKMPMDESKIKDLLRNQHIFRDRMNKEIGTYQPQQDHPTYEHGLLKSVDQLAFGDLRALVEHVGIKRLDIPYVHPDELLAMKRDVSANDGMNFRYLQNAYFTPLDMTDYEENFVGWNEVGDFLPLSETNWIAHL
jgi:hypothetical protein